MIRNMTDIQRQRAVQYAVCTFALDLDHVTDGAEGVFDQALTNGLAAIVAHEWPGEELRKTGGTLFARALLGVIAERGQVAEDGTVRILRLDEPEWIESPFDDDPIPTFTSVHVATLEDALDATQALRHARDGGDNVAGLTNDHLEALRDLDDHPALFALDEQVIDRAEEGVDAAKAVESSRSADYWWALEDEERGRRRTINYTERYAWETQDSRCEVDRCPVCWTEALVASEFDSYLGEIGIGMCIACSYARTRDVADDAAMDVQIRRHMERND